MSHPPVPTTRGLKDARSIYPPAAPAPACWRRDWDEIEEEEEEEEEGPGERAATSTAMPAAEARSDSSCKKRREEFARGVDIGGIS